MAYLNFISDADLEKHIKSLYSTYKKANNKNENLVKFYDNQIDSIKALFDISFNNLTAQEYVEIEILRKRDKSISNAIGKFHKKLLVVLTLKNKWNY